LLAFDVVAGQLAQAELVGVVAHALEAQFAAQLLKVEVVALGQRLGHVHAEAGQLHRRVARDQALRERGHGHGELDGGAGLGARRERQLLVDHGQDAAVGGIDDHGGAVHVAQASIAAWRTTGSSPAVTSPAKMSPLAKELAVKRS
jgi:hypothetical protein